MKNNIIEFLQKNKVGWSALSASSMGMQFVNTLSACMLVLDGHHETLAERSCTIPSELKFLSGYNKPESHKHMQKEAGRKFNTNTHHGTLCWSAEPNKNVLYEIRCVDRSACSCPNIGNKSSQVCILPGTPMCKGKQLPQSQTSNFSF